MELDGYLRFVVALAFVLALIALFAWLARRFGIGSGAVRRQARGKRLSVVEAAAVDGRRRLVLLRRDDVEHLVLMGPQSEVVIETGIPAPANGTSAAAETSPAPPQPEPAKGEVAS
ncbi:MAG: flagellar biosynthetic protein FliO [Alphaproteobacteria bacterium]|nr:flagellar biosynthetic protein FliO [Alphaproteobacteria bacterium]